MKARQACMWIAGWVGLASAILSGSARAAIEIDGQMVEVVDMHLHPGHFGQMPNSGIEFLGAAMPPQAQLFTPALFERQLDPYAEHIGVKAQTEMAGVDHAVLLAVYAHHTSGYFTNSQLLSALLDDRNTSSNPQRPKWAWGMVSINFDDFNDPSVADDRLAAMSSYLEHHPDLIIGIKLAHAHQQVTFDSPEHMGVYDVAAKYGVPVLLHTGFSPFPNSMDDPAAYDPQALETVITNYNGTHGLPMVRFVFAHAGQGDARSVEHALQLAETHPNVFLDLSALKRPLLIDEKGDPSTSTDNQYPYVLEQIKLRGIIDRALWSTDGPQFSGMVRSYLELIVQGMKDAEYTTKEIAKVLSGNFYDVFFPNTSG